MLLSINKHYLHDLGHRAWRDHGLLVGLVLPGSQVGELEDEGTSSTGSNSKRAALPNMRLQRQQCLITRAGGRAPCIRPLKLTMADPIFASSLLVAMPADAV